MNTTTTKRVTRNRRAKGKSYGILITNEEAPLFGKEGEFVINYNEDWPASWVDILDDLGKLGKLAGGKWAERHDKPGYGIKVDRRRGLSRTPRKGGALSADYGRQFKRSSGKNGAKRAPINTKCYERV